MYRATGDRVREQEGQQMHSNFQQTLMKDQVLSLQLPEHNLIFWTDGPLPSSETLRGPASTGAGGNASTSGNPTATY